MPNLKSIELPWGGFSLAANRAENDGPQRRRRQVPGKGILKDIEVGLAGREQEMNEIQEAVTAMGHVDERIRTYGDTHHEVYPLSAFFDLELNQAYGDEFFHILGQWKTVYQDSSMRVEIMEEIAPNRNDIIVTKEAPSPVPGKHQALCGRDSHCGHGFHGPDRGNCKELRGLGIRPPLGKPFQQT